MLSQNKTVDANWKELIVLQEQIESIKYVLDKMYPQSDRVRDIHDYLKTQLPNMVEKLNQFKSNAEIVIFLKRNMNHPLSPLWNAVDIRMAYNQLSQ